MAPDVFQNHPAAQAFLHEGASNEVHQTVGERVALTLRGKCVIAMEETAILQARNLAGRPAEALEIGCEGGRWSKILADAGWKLTCVDVDPEALKACRAKMPDARLVLSNTETKLIDAPDQTFSLV